MAWLLSYENIRKEVVGTGTDIGINMQGVTKHERHQASLGEDSAVQEERSFIAEKE